MRASEAPVQLMYGGSSCSIAIVSFEEVWPDSLLPVEHERWNAYRRQRLGADDRPALPGHDFGAFRAEMSQLRGSGSLDASQRALLDALEQWADAIARDIATTEAGA